MKKSNYNIFVKHAGYVICYNSYTNTLLCVSNNVYQAFEELDAKMFEKQYTKHFSAFLQAGFYIDDERDELDEIRLRHKISVVGLPSNFRLMVYPTQDCNLKCWYCYEKHISNTKMSREVMDNIVKYASNIIHTTNIESFILSFFGGEPLFFFEEIAYKLSIRIKQMCDEKKISFITFFITNGTLITQDNIMLFKEINPVFQITLDGCRQKHDKVRIRKKDNLPTYDKIIESLSLISKHLNTDVEDQMVTLRINYDNQTLKDIQELLDDISGLDRKKFIVHFVRVWQTQSNSANEEQIKLLLHTIRLFMLNGFKVKVGDFKTRDVSCPAENLNFAVINYNGKVYRCNGRTLEADNKEGVLLNNGTIKWNPTLLAKRLGRTTFENPMCLNCKMLPVCMGPCSQKCMENNWQNVPRICTMHNLGMSINDYLTLWAEQIFIENMNSKSL